MHLNISSSMLNVILVLKCSETILSVVASNFCSFLIWLRQILTLEERVDSSGETQEERQGKMLLHTEYSLLSLLHNQDGVVHHHGLFQVDLHTLGSIQLH